MKAWLDGDLVDESAPAVALDDLGLLRGLACFETMKVLDSVPFALTRHLARLHRSCAVLDIAVPDDDVSRRACAEVLAANGAGMGWVRLTVTAAGVVAATAGPPRPHPPTTAVALCPWARNERSATAGAKTTSYAENVVAERWAAARGCGEALFANTRGELCEGTTSNVFVALGGRLVTPPLSSGCLAGVTRDLLVEELGVEERDVPVEALAAADELFVTSSTRDIQPAHSVDGRELPAPGPLTAAAQAAWQRIEARSIDP